MSPKFLLKKKASAVFIMLLSSSLCMSLTSPSLFAGTFDDFKNKIVNEAQSVAESRLNALASDIGAAIAQTSFHQASTIGGTLPGVDIGIHTGYKKVSSKDDILKAANVESLMLPVAQIEIGIPFIKLDLIGRYTSYDKSTLAGGGLRYSLFKTLPFELTASGLYNILSVEAGDNKFKTTVTTLSLGINFNVPIISPYAGVSFDSTEITPDETITTFKGKATATRIDGGVNLSLLPFTYFNAGISYIISGSDDSSLGARAGLGIKF